MIYENFTKRRAKVMIFDSAGNTRSGFAKTNEKQKIETMKKKNTNSRSRRRRVWQKPRATINKQTHSIIFERILIYHRWWRATQREKEQENAWNMEQTPASCWFEWSCWRYTRCGLKGRRKKIKQLQCFDSSEKCLCRIASQEHINWERINFQAWKKMIRFTFQHSHSHTYCAVLYIDVPVATFPQMRRGVVRWETGRSHCCRDTEKKIEIYIWPCNSSYFSLHTPLFIGSNVHIKQQS